MKRAAICVQNPQDYIDQLSEYSLVILNPSANADRNNYILENSDWSLLITDTEERYRNGRDYPNEKLFMYTSGTTGDSKFYSFSQDQLDILTSNVVSAYNITANDVFASVMPLWHAYGQTFYWAAKKASCELHHFTVKNWHLSPQCRPTYMATGPAFLRTLVKFNFNSLDFIISAGGKFKDENEYNQLKDQFNAPILESFGMTEAMGHCFTNPRYGEQRFNTIGLPFGVDVKIDLANHLHLKGPACAFSDWFDTGDLAEQDEKHYYKLLGRSDDQIRSKGVMLNPATIEAQLLKKFPEISDCAVFGQDSVNCMYVGDCAPEQIQKFLLSLGSHCKAHKLVKVDKIPLNFTGKVSRSYLNQLIK